MQVNCIKERFLSRVEAYGALQRPNRDYLTTMYARHLAALSGRLYLLSPSQGWKPLGCSVFALQATRDSLPQSECNALCSPSTAPTVADHRHARERRLSSGVGGPRMNHQPRLARRLAISKARSAVSNRIAPEAELTLAQPFLTFLEP
jgi:hypothetical protein